jgi:hypothetical protein
MSRVLPQSAHPGLGVADFGVVGQVAGKAHAGLGHDVPFLVPGRAVCPALGPGDGGCRGVPRELQGQATEPTKAARSGSGCRAGSAQGSGWLVGRWRLGSGMPAPSGQIPPPWARLENEAPTTRAARRPVQARTRSLGQLAEGGGGVVMSLATRPTSPLRVAVLGRSDLLDDRVWSLLGQDVQEAWPVEQAEAVDQAGRAVAEDGCSL